MVCSLVIVRRGGVWQFVHVRACTPERQPMVLQSQAGEVWRAGTDLAAVEVVIVKPGEAVPPAGVQLPEAAGVHQLEALQEQCNPPLE